MGDVNFDYKIGFKMKEVGEKVSKPYGSWLWEENVDGGLEEFENISWIAS